jgi:hypothetical protein
MDSPDGREWVSPRKFLARHKGVIGRNALYDLIRQNRIECLRLSDRKFLVPSDALDRMYESEMAVSA